MKSQDISVELNDSVKSYNKKTNIGAESAITLIISAYFFEIRII